MSQFYLNGPSEGRAMSAEEFAAGTGQRPGTQPCPPTNGCGCGNTSSPMSCGCGSASPDCPAGDCGQTGRCCQQMICCCHAMPAPAPQPPEVEEGCCCKQSFRAALSLLCDQQISSLLDFDTAAFITNTYTAGTTLTGGKPYAGDAAVQAGGDGDDAGTKGKPTQTPPCNSSGASDNLGTLSGRVRRVEPGGGHRGAIEPDL